MKYSDKELREFLQRRCVVLKGDDGKSVAALVSKDAWNAAWLIALHEMTSPQRAGKKRGK